MMEPNGFLSGRFGESMQGYGLRFERGLVNNFQRFGNLLFD